MTIKHFNDLMAHAESEGYAVGYFEGWSLESLLAIADAAEATQSPVLMGFSGIYLNHPQRVRSEMLSIYSTMGLEVCQQVAVPTTLVFNESPHRNAVMEAIELGFGLVMFSDDRLSFTDQTSAIRQIVETAHKAGTAVEGEAQSLPGVGGDLIDIPEDARLTGVETALKFVEQTGVHAFAVNLGQLHLHGKRAVHLDLDLLRELYDALDVPLVLHGATSVSESDLVDGIRFGIRKINVGSALKQVYFEALRAACEATGDNYNPYEVIGSGLSEDVLMAGRIALQRKVEHYMRLFGSDGKAILLS
jgi:fructose-bisphosphate aldolase class II